MGAQASVIDLDVIKALCSKDPTVKCVTIRDKDVTGIEIDNEMLKECGDIVEMISRLDRMRTFVVTKTLAISTLTCQVVTALSTKNQLLELIDLSGSAMDQAAAETLRSIMSKQRVVKLRLRSCRMDCKQLSQLLAGFREAKGKIDELDITGNEVTPKLLMFNQDVFFNDAVKWTRWMGEEEPESFHPVGNDELH